MRSKFCRAEVAERDICSGNATVPVRITDFGSTGEKNGKISESKVMLPESGRIQEFQAIVPGGQRLSVENVLKNRVFEFLFNLFEILAPVD